MRVFVVPPPGSSAALHTALGDLAEIVSDLSGWHVVQAPSDVDVAPPGAPLWLRGYEAGGWCGPVTALVLIRAAAASGRRWVVEGLGPRAMAATLALGAEGIVVGPALWASADAGLDPAVRRRIADASGRDTVVFGELAGRRVRLLSRGASMRAIRDAAVDADALAALVDDGLRGWAGRADGLVPAPQSIGNARTCAAPTAQGALDRLLAQVARHRSAHPHHPLRSDPFGTGTCVVQGPMANVAEGPGLARAVAEAGGLPCFALGALRPAQARAVLDNGAQLPGPWGVGIIGFDVAPWREAHLAALRDADPAPAAVVIAGGSPALAMELAADGLDPWLHTPSPRLVDDALAAGATVVLEGHEAGGHVGVLSSVGLWEESLARVEDHGGGSVVLAGGIGDPVSAAFAGAMAASAAEAGARVGLQAGTAFFFTHEAVEHGQITPEYQRAALAARDTTLVGSSANLALRCVPNAFTRTTRSLERTELATVDRRTRRERLEAHNLGRTRVAAKGIERAPSWPAGPRYRDVPTARQRTDGAFTMGQGATVEADLWTVEQVVRRLSVDAAALLEGGLPRRGVRSVVGAPRVVGRAPKRTDDPRIAIVGVGCVLPGAADVDSFWRALVQGRDAVGAIPDERWDPRRYWDPTAGGHGPAKTASLLAGAVRGFTFDPLAFRLPPSVVPTLDRSQQLALVASAQAVRGLTVDRHRAAVVLGNSMGGEHAKSLAVRVRFREVLAALADGGVHLPPGTEDTLEQALDDRLPPVVADSMAGLLSNVVSGRVASWLDWMGGNHTVDAACAASLAAVHVAVDMLRARRADLVLTGGVDTDLSPETYVGFSRTRALSGTGSHPFATHADGFVMGEGCAVFALQRLDDALAAGHPVWAVIRGVGQASDGRGRGITAPRAEGQELAIRRATADAGLARGDVRAWEAHGTGTPLGDATELGVIARWQGDAPTWLGSVKSMLGHLKGAAGAAGLLKAVLASATGVLPPTLHAGPVRDGGGTVRLPRSPVRLPDDAPIGVSAFGFGGTDHHVIVSSAPAGAPLPGPVPTLRRLAAPLVPGTPVVWGASETPLVLVYGAPDATTLRARVRQDRPAAADVAHAHRLVVLTTDARRADAVDRVARWLDAPTGRPPPGVWHGTGAPRPVVVLVPGQGGATARPPDPLLFPADTTAPDGVDPSALARWEPLAVHRRAASVTEGWAGLLARAGITPVATAGHSLGELGALRVAGWLDADGARALADLRGRALAACPSGAMLAVRTDDPTPPPGCALAAVNAPGRVVWSGPPAAVDRIAASRPDARRLPVPRAYHSSEVAPAAAALRTAPVRIAPTPVAVWSTADAAPMSEARAALARAVTGTVRFAETVTALAAEHPDAVFVELGPGRSLSAATAASVPEATVVPLDSAGDRSVPVRAAAALVAAGHPGLLGRISGAWMRVAAPVPAPGDLPDRARDLAARARAVEDLRIAALADPAATDRYEQARTTLLATLAAQDAGTPAPPMPATTERLPAAPVSPATAVHPPQGRAPSLAPPPSPGSPPTARTPASSDDDLHAAVVDAICTITGYPPEFLDDDLDLEAELGVDSIKKLEIVGILQKRFGFQASEADYARLSDAGVATLVEWLAGHVRDVDVPPATPARTTRVWAPLDIAGPPPEPPAGAIGRLGGGWVLDARRLPSAPLEQALSLARWAAGADPGPLLAIADPDSLAAGFARSLARDWQTEVRVVRHDGALRSWVRCPTVPGSPLAEGAVIVASGGAGGITNACLAALADRRPRILCLGRSEPGSDRVMDGVRRLTAAGATVRYVRCDVSDVDAVRVATAGIRKDWGPPTLVVHGAGVLRDGPVDRVSVDDATVVLGTKLGGAHALIAATREDPVDLFVTFGSIVATAGNAGQTLYGAANAALAGVVHPSAARSLCIAWTAWSEVGMAASPGLQSLLQARGITPVRPEDGAQVFRRLVSDRVAGPVIVAADAPATSPVPWPIGGAAPLPDGAVLQLDLDARDPRLADHRVAGRALVPAAVWARLALDAARLTGHRATCIRGFRVLHPTFVDDHRDDVRCTLEAGRTTITTGDTVVAEASLGRAAVTGRPTPAEPVTSMRPFYAPHLLFHGPTWRVLASAGATNAGAVASLVPGEHDVATAIDAAHQLLCVWAGCRVGWLGLPVGAASWSVGGDAPCARIEVAAEVDGDDIVATVHGFSADGAPVLAGSGVRLRRAASWPDDAPMLARAREPTRA